MRRAHTSLKTQNSKLKTNFEVKHGSYFGSCQGSVKEEIRGALSQPLQALRQVGRRIASMNNQFAAYRSGRQPHPYPVDLNQVILAALEEVDEKDRVQCELADHLPPVMATRLPFAGAVVPLPGIDLNSLQPESVRVRW